MRLFSAAVFVVSLGVAFPVLASGDGHNHEAAVEAAPHGGNLRDSGKYKSEIVIAGDNVKIYFYDKKLKPVKAEAEKIQGEVEFPKQKRKPVTLTKSGDIYEGKIEGLGKVHRYDLHFNVVLQGTKFVADFGVDNI